MNKKAKTGARYVLGLIFTVFGFNGFFQFMPMPEMSSEAGAFMGGLMGAGYFFPMMNLVKIASGVMLLANRYVALALVLLAPIIVNIVMFHLFLDLKGMPMALVVLACEVYLAYCYKNSYKGVLKA